VGETRPFASGITGLAAAAPHVVIAILNCSDVENLILEARLHPQDHVNTF
jgi:hypothetical protein